MLEVSCRAFSYFQAAEKSGLISLDALLDGLPARAVFEAANGRVSWEHWATLCDRFEAALPDEASLRATSAYALAEGFSGYLGKMIGLFTDVRQLYELAGRWAGPSLYRCMRFSVSDRGDGTLDFSVELLPGYRPCRAWFVMVEGSMAHIPALAGLPRAQVERLSLTDRSAAWRVRPPLSASLGAGYRRVVAALRAPQAIFDELFTQQGQLTDAFAHLRASSEAFRSTLEALPLLVAVHERGELRYANTAFATYFDRPQGELEGLTLASLFPPSERAHLESLLVGGASPAPVSLQVRSGPSERCLEARAGGAVDFGGRRGTLFFARDVTSEQRTERRAARSEGALGAVVGALPELVACFSADTTLLSIHGGTALPWSGWLASLVGTRLDDVFEQVPLGHRLPAAAHLMREELQDALRRATPRSRTFSVEYPDGGARELLLRFVPLEGDVLVIVHDRTQELADEHRLAVAERMVSLGTLAAGVAHEINNPLTWVMADLEVLREQWSARGPIDETAVLLAEMDDGCRRIRDTVGRMREYSRVDRGSRCLLSLSGVIERAALLTQTELRYRARLELDLAPGLEVVANPTALGEVVVDLLLNAAQAMPEGATPETHRVRVGTRTEEGQAVMEVTDDGVGIAAAHLPRIFDPFFSTRHATPIAGLGLAIAHRIVAAHGGTIAARSVPGKTTLSVRLPLPTPGQLAVASPPRTTPARRARVLVVDDEPLLGRSIQRALSSHEVVVVEDGRAAFGRLREGELPDLVLCDLMMSGFSGMELYAALALARPETLRRVAFMTGGAFTPVAEEFLRDHPVQLLQKPFPLGLLDTLLDQVLTTGTTEGFARG